MPSELLISSLCCVIICLLLSTGDAYKVSNSKYGYKVSASDPATTTTTKVVEIEHVPVKEMPVHEQTHHHLPPKHSQVVIEESHEVMPPQSMIELSPIGLPMGAQGYSKHFALQTSKPNTHFLLQVVPPGVRRKQESSIPDLLAVLAPLAAIPLLGSLAVSSFTTMLTLTGLGRRRKRDLTLHRDVFDQLTAPRGVSLLHLDLTNNHTEEDRMHRSEEDIAHNTSSNNNLFNPFESLINSTSAEHGNSFAKELPLFGESTEEPKAQNPISELFQLDVVQQYLRQSGRPDHNDQIIASYLACRGMFSNGNHCLERLACHYADMQNGRLRPLERDVAALIIYSLLRNTHIDSTFKRRLQRAALFGYDHMTEKSTLTYEASFVPVCDREFPCPKSEMP